MKGHGYSTFILVVPRAFSRTSLSGAASSKMASMVIGSPSKDTAYCLPGSMMSIAIGVIWIARILSSKVFTIEILITGQMVLSPAFTSLPTRTFASISESLIFSKVMPIPSSLLRATLSPSPAGPGSLQRLPTAF